MLCGCWAVPEVLKKPVIVRNSKYCWLYPKYERKELKKLEPNFDKAPTLYTKCDFVLEQCAQESISKIEMQLNAYNELQCEEIEQQKPLIVQLWKLSQRYIILTRGGIGCKLYPDMVSVPTERHDKCVFIEIMRKLLHSLAEMALALDEIRESIKELNRRCAQLDMTVESPFLLGSLNNKPLAYIRNLIDDWFQYHYDVFCKLKRWSQLIQINDAIAIEDYEVLLKATENFKEFLTFCSSNCHCMRTHNPECIRPHIPCKEPKRCHYEDEEN